MVTVHVPATSLDSKLPADGIFYALPRTVVSIDVPIDLTESKPGAYADYAPIFFPERKAVKTAEKKLSVKLAKFSTFGEPDPSAVYYVKVVGGAAVDWSRTFQLNEDGTITSGKEQADNQISDIVLGTLSAAAGLAAKGIGAAAPCPAAISGEQAILCYLNALGAEYADNFENLKSKDQALFDRIIAKNTQDTNGSYTVKLNAAITKAVESALKIVLLTNQRESMLTNPMPAVNLSDAIFTRIDALITERVNGFTGTETKSTWTGSFEVRPKQVTDIVLLFKINPPGGLCVVTDVAGKEQPPSNFLYNFGTSEKPDTPVYCKSGGDGLMDVRVQFSPAKADADQMLTRIRNNYNVVADEDTTPFKEERSFRFRIPAYVKASLVTEAKGSIGSETRILVGQFGSIVALPATPGGKSSMYSLQYYASTGALKNFDLTTKAVLTKATVDSLNGSAASILDAEYKAAQAKAKAADQLNQLDRTRSILEDQVKILAACKTLNIDCSKP
jgi:hypothetical protein